MAANGDDVPKLKDLVYELKDVDWHELGVQLDVPRHILKNIDKENPTEARKLSEVLHHWLNNGDANWKEIIKALRRIGNHGNIIKKIELEYGIPSTHPIETVQAQQQHQDKKSGFKTVTVYKDQVLGKAAANSPLGDSTRLNERDHHTKLLDQLKLHATKWRDIGTSLGFLQGELDNIQSKPMLLMQGSSGYLNEMLSVWYQWAPGDGRGSKDFATLGALKNAMRQAGLGRAANDLSLN